MLQDLQEYLRLFYRGMLCLILLFVTALATSFVGSFAGGSSDAAYGEEELSYANFSLPEDPVMDIWVWQKQSGEKRELVTLKPRSPVSTGPSVAWASGLARVYGADNVNGSGSSFTSQLPFELNGLTISIQAEGMITARWEHEKNYDCGYTHTWWYSVDPELTGGVDRMKLQRNARATAEGTNSLCLLWQGEGGWPADTVTVTGEAADCAGHSVRSLADVLGEDPEHLNETVTQDRMQIQIHLECRDLLGRLEAVAVLRATMVSSWKGAGALYEKELPDIIAAESRGEEAFSRWIDYAVQRPTWTVELIWYSER